MGLAKEPSARCGCDRHTNILQLCADLVRIFGFEGALAYSGGLQGGLSVFPPRESCETALPSKRQHGIEEEGTRVLT